MSVLDKFVDAYTVVDKKLHPRQYAAADQAFDQMISCNPNCTNGPLHVYGGINALTELLQQHRNHPKTKWLLRIEVLVAYTVVAAWINRWVVPGDITALGPGVFGLCWWVVFIWRTIHNRTRQRLQRAQNRLIERLSEYMEGKT